MDGDEARVASLIGRDQELARLLEGVGGPDRVLLLTGAPGAGRTGLWWAAVGATAAAGWRIVDARAAEAGSRIPFAGLCELLRGVQRRGLAEAPVAREALEAMSSADRQGAADVRAVGTGLLHLLRELSRDGRVLIAIDDAQWLDAESADALAFAVRRLDPAGAHLLLTAPTGSPCRVAQSLDSAGVRRVPVAGLTFGATRRLLDERLGVPLPRRVCRQVYEATQGNPRLSLEIGSAVAAGPQGRPEEEALPVPEGVCREIDDRVAGLPEPTKEALLAVALMSDPSLSEIARLFGPDAAGVLDPARRRDIIELRGEQVLFRHPLFGAALIAAAFPEQRRDLHGRIAGHCADPVLRARHLALATPEPDPDVAQALEDAAASAEERRAWDLAAELWEQATDHTPEDLGKAAVRRAVAAADYDLRSGDRLHAKALVGPYAATPWRAEALLVLARISAHDDGFVRATGLYEQALAQATAPATRAEIQLGLSDCHSERQHFIEAYEYARHARTDAEASADEALLARALAACAVAGFRAGQGIDWPAMRRGLAVGDDAEKGPMRTRPRFVEGVLHAWDGRPGQASEALDALSSEARSRGDDCDLALVLGWLSWAEVRAGRHEAAVIAAREATALATRAGGVTDQVWARAQLAWALAHRGDTDEVRELYDDTAASATDSDSLLALETLAAAEALAQQSLGNPQAAWEAGEPSTVAWERGHLAEPAMFSAFPDVVDALTALGQLDRAEALVASVEERSRALARVPMWGSAARCRGAVAAARGDTAASLAAFDDALLILDEVDAPFERARTLLARGAVERRVQRRTAARASLEEAVAQFEGMGARVWADRARVELGRIGGRRAASRTELTPGERRVAELAAQGLSNKDIAAQLFVSVHTVEAHLSKAFAKLGARSRSQLSGLLPPEDPQS